MVKYPVSTQKTQSGHGVSVGVLNALLFSLNAALLFVPIISVRMKYPILLVGQRIFYFVSAHWPIQIPSAVRTADPNRLGFATLVLSLTALLCVLLLVTSQFRLVAKFLRVVPGIIAVVGFPTYMLTISGSPVAAPSPATFTRTPISALLVPQPNGAASNGVEGSDCLGPDILEPNDLERDFVLRVKPGDVVFLGSHLELFVGVLYYDFDPM